MQTDEPFKGAFPKGVPYSNELGIRFERRSERGLVYRLPWRADLVGHPDTGWLFGGVLFALLDHALGTACGMQVLPERAVATIDLRLDYTAVNERGRDILAAGECYRLTRQVAFARGLAYHDDPARPLASAQGTFMIYDVPPAWHGASA